MLDIHTFSLFTGIDMENSEKMLQLKKYFENSVKMALEEKLSWSILASLLDDMASNLVECKQLIRILLKELQIMHKDKQVENIHEILPETGADDEIEMQGNANDEYEVIEEILKDDKSYNQKAKDVGMLRVITRPVRPDP